MPTIITMPASLYSFSAMRFNIFVQNTVSDTGPFSPQPDVDGPTFARWRARLSFTPAEDGVYDDDRLDDLDQFISLLKGGLNLARIYDLRKADGPRGTGGLGPVVNVAANVAAGATSVTLKNLVPSEAVAFRKMDQIGRGENLHRIQYSGPSDSAGEGTFEIWPPTRFGWAEDDTVNTLNPTGLFRLVEGQDDLTIVPGMMSDTLTLSFEEVPDFA